MLAQVSSWRATRLLPSELQSLHLLNGNQVKKVKVLVALSSRLFVVPWTVARQAPLSMGILQARRKCQMLPEIITAQGGLAGTHCLSPVTDEETGSERLPDPA